MDSPKGGQILCPPIALPIEIVHLEPPSSGHLSTPDNGQPASLRAPKDMQQSVQNNLQKRTETKQQA